MQNPFKYGCVVSGDHFCLRPKAERTLRQFAESGQNVVGQGERRMGQDVARAACVRRHARTEDRIYGAAFLNAVGLANAGAVRKAVQRLEANDLVYEHEGSYRFNDSFFRAWVLESL